MKNSALAQALEAAQPVDLDPGKLPRIAPANPPIPPPPAAAAMDLLRAFRRRPEATSPGDDSREPTPPRVPPAAAAMDSLRAFLRRREAASPGDGSREAVSPRVSPSAVAPGRLRAVWRRLRPIEPRDDRRAPAPPHGLLLLPPTAAPRGLLHAVWLRLFGPPAIDPRYDSREFGVFRAFAEVGSDYLPSSGTWPSTSDRS
jgi:hypothetical protein